jgi:hypothetical protein
MSTLGNKIRGPLTMFFLGCSSPDPSSKKEVNILKINNNWL